MKTEGESMKMFVSLLKVSSVSRPKDLRAGDELAGRESDETAR
jgi:hypothetical protein